MSIKRVALPTLQTILDEQFMPYIRNRITDIVNDEIRLARNQLERRIKELATEVGFRLSAAELADKCSYEVVIHVDVPEEK